MKTLSQKQALNQLNELTIISETNPYPIHKQSKAYLNAKRVIMGEKAIRPAYTLGKGRYCTNQDHTAATIVILEKLGIESILTNDSPRGGLAGNLLTITTIITD